MKRAKIVIPTCDRKEDLKHFLRVLIPNIPSDESVNILVCDEGFTDESRQMLVTEFASVGWQQGPRKGPSVNRNLGARISDCEWPICLSIWTTIASRGPFSFPPI